MRSARPERWLGLGVCVALLVGCASRDTRSNAAAAQAQTLFTEGQYVAARRSIHRAISIRDDVSDYWQLLGRIDVAASDLTGAYDAYQHVIELDRSNVEALRAVGQLSLSLNDPHKADEYADQLLLLNPDDPDALIMKGSAALEIDDKAKALDFANSVLRSNPRNIGAILLQARELFASGQGPEAARLVEGSMTLGGDPTSRLIQLRDVYQRGGDRLNFERTVDRLAASHPDNASFLLDYAQSLYARGQFEKGRATVARIMRLRPDDTNVSAQILDLLRLQGADAIPKDEFVAAARNVSPEMKSDYAQLAVDLHSPGLAAAILGPQSLETPVDVTNADIKATYAAALAALGDRANAAALLDQILKFDPNQPRALMARARLSATDGNGKRAITDVRKVIADDPQNAGARLFLADVLLALHENLLGLAALREAAHVIPADTRIAGRLATLLISMGQPSEASNVLRDLTRSAPVSLPAWKLREELCVQIRDDACIAISHAAINGNASLQPSHIRQI